MNIRLLVLILSALPVAALPGLASAGGGFASMAYVHSSIEPPDSNNKAKVDALQFNFGGWLNAQRTLGIEGRAALGFSDDTIRFENGQRTKVEMNRYFGAYMRAQFPDTMPVRPYGLVGLSRAETTERDASGSSSRSYSDVSLGFGVDVTLDHNIYFTVEYMRLADRSSREISNLMLGIGGRF